MYSDDFKNPGLDENAAKMLRFKKNNLEEQKKMQELRKIQSEMMPLIQEINFTKARITEMKALLRRLESESVRAKQNFERQQKEEEAAENNVEAEQKNLSDTTSSTGSALKTLEADIKKEKEIIKEHQVRLISLEKRDNDIKNIGDKKGREEKSILSRLLNVFDREKKEAQTAKMVLAEFTARRDNAMTEMDRLNVEFEKLENKLTSLKRKL